MKANENIPEILQAARMKLAQARPYIQRALWSVPVFIDDKVVDPSGAPTLGVDKWWRLYANPAYMEQCTVDELATTVYHEIDHLLHAHAERSDIHGVGLNHAVWNLAGDMAINDGIMQEQASIPTPSLTFKFPKNYGVLPKDAVKMGCPKPLPSGWTTEAYYDELCKHAKKVTVSCECGSGSGGAKGSYELDGPGKDGKDGNQGLTPAQQEMVRQIVAREVVEHAKAKGRGTVPAGLLVWAEERVDPQVPWERVLASLIRRCIGAEVLGHQTPSFKRPHRRSAVLSKILLPTRWKPTPIVDVTIDTSGSMHGDKRFIKALTEVDALLNRSAAKVYVRSCDAAVTAAKKAMKSIRPEQMVGGGGTDMRIGVAAALEAKPRPHLIVVVTDGETPWPVEETAIPLVIVLVGSKGAKKETPSWAHTVYVGEEG